MRTSVFICYSHADAKFCRELVTVLQPCSDAIDVWSDHSIPSGVEWLPAIDEAMTRADAALIVVSPDLLASKFVTSHELPRIFRRHRDNGMRPMWIHLRPALYSRTRLADFQCLHAPSTPLSTLRRPERERVLVKIANQLCEPPPQTVMGNLLRAADEVFTGETGTSPSVTTLIRADRIDFQDGKYTRPFVTYPQLETRLGSDERRILRACGRAMAALVRRWEKLHPIVTAAGTAARPSDAAELATVRSTLADEFDHTMGFIESLGYNLHDHYLGVRDVLQSSAVATPAPSSGPAAALPARVTATRPKPRIAARFVLDKKGRPQWSAKENGYWLQVSVEDAPARAASVVWRMHPTISPSRETVDARPEFRKDFVAYGDFVIRADVRNKKRAAIATLEHALSDALERQYPGRQAKAVQKAMREVAGN